MKVINKITKRDVTKYYLALMMNLITREEFEEVAMVRPNTTNKIR
jgi:hypothetical protein